DEINKMDLPKDLKQGLAQIAATALGAAIGGAAGAASGLNVEANNRQLHPEEKQRIHELANGNPTLEARLSAAACALAHCSAEYAVGSKEYNYYTQVEALGNSPDLAGERLKLSQQTAMFGYTTTGVFSDANFDAGKRINNTYQITTRTLGTLQAVGGAATAVAGAGITAGGAITCPETGVGCLVAAGGVALTGWGLDQSKAGVSTSINGQVQPTIGGQALQSMFGISSGAAELLYGMVGGVAGIAADAALASRGAAVITTAPKVANGASGNSGILALNELTPVSPVASGGVNATKVTGNGYALIDLTPAEANLAKQVAAQGDKSGAVTETIVESVAQRQGLNSLEGGKYGSNNGFDHVLQNSDGTVTILIDSKQMTNGTFKLSQEGAGNAMQMSDEWVQNVLLRIDPTSPAFKAVDMARKNGTLVKGVAGVDRANGQVTIVRIK
ncbi:hypothetical protein, partial [Collimonas silvisoli]|uniref:hypothetical protein n=1 Tax=Collimonas silvisoli TaxID=2825884 RepID=UPI001B8CE016